MGTLGRNDLCPCGARKAKKCAHNVVGFHLDVARWIVDMLQFFESCDGYQPPISDADKAKLLAIPIS